jgi:hypothetical protein
MFTLNKYQKAVNKIFDHFKVTAVLVPALFWTTAL